MSKRKRRWWIRPLLKGTETYYSLERGNDCLYFDRIQEYPYAKPSEWRFWYKNSCVAVLSRRDNRIMNLEDFPEARGIRR